MGKMFVCGDIHGDIDIRKLYNDDRLKNLTKDDYVIICGDAGIVWNTTNDEMIAKYDAFPFTTLFVDGNHENHDVLNSYPVTEWNGGKVHKISNSIIHLMRGQIYEINGKKFFTMGGATSIDKGLRTEGVSWWRTEMPSREEYEEALDNLEKVNYEVDYVLTHCAPYSILGIMDFYCRWYERDALTSFFDHLEFENNLKFKMWFFGHYHMDRNIENKYICLYDVIEEIK